VSDTFITEQSNILDNLLPGDLVMADQGFLIHESVGLRCSEVVMPSFTRGRMQLKAADVMHSKQVSNVRIHVERVIGQLRQKYTLRGSKVDLQLLTRVGSEPLTQLDKIVFICSALCNTCKTVVPSF